MITIVQADQVSQETGEAVDHPSTSKIEEAISVKVINGKNSD